MRVLVVGDSCQDIFIYGDIERISPEAPVPVFVPSHKEKNDGMARNVSHNVESLKMYIHTITNKNGIVKKRYVDNRSGQMVLRVDEHDYCERIPTKTLQGITNNKFSGQAIRKNSNQMYEFDYKANPLWLSVEKEETINGAFVSSITLSVSDAFCR